MGIIQNIKNTFSKKETETRIKMINQSYGNYFVFNNKMYESDIIMSCVKQTAKAVSKSVPKHIRSSTDENGKKTLSTNPDTYMKFLLSDPNPWSNRMQMLEQVTISYLLNNNAFIMINRDENGYPLELYPLQVSTVESSYDENGFMSYKFQLTNGKSLECPYENVIHLKQEVCNDYIFGQSPYEKLTSLMEIVQTTDQGMVKAIKNSAIIKWIVKFVRDLNPADKKANLKEFVDEYLDVDGESKGVIAVDNKYDVKQVDNKQEYIPNAPQMIATVKRIYALFNTNEKIIHSNYTEDEWNSFYESVIEPIITQLSLEFTRKLFTRKERSFGNEIIFDTSNLSYASNSTKLQFVQMVDRNSMVPDEWRALFGYGPIDGGDKPLLRKDTEQKGTQKGGDE